MNDLKVDNNECFDFIMVRDFIFFMKDRGQFVRVYKIQYFSIL